MTDIQESTAGQRVRADELGASFVQLDVTDDASVAAAFDHLRRVENRLDVLVNNAGIYATGVGTADLTAKDSLKEFDTNVVGVVRVTQAALPMLRRSTNAVVVTKVGASAARSYLPHTATEGAPMTADPFDAIAITPTVAPPGIRPIVIGLGVALVTGPKRLCATGSATANAPRSRTPRRAA